jgi:hypothetical protein
MMIERERMFVSFSLSLLFFFRPFLLLSRSRYAMNERECLRLFGQVLGEKKKKKTIPRREMEYFTSQSTGNIETIDTCLYL